MKIKKINWINLIKLILLVILATIITRDVFMLTFYSWLTSESIGFTWFGLFTFILFFAISCKLYEDLFKQEKSADVNSTNSES